VLKFVEFNVSSLNEVKNSTRSSDNDVGWVVSEQLDVVLLGDSTVDNFRRYSFNVFLESIKLFLDLIGELSVVSKNHGNTLVGIVIELVEESENEDGSLAHS